MGAMLPQGVAAEEVLREINSFTDKDVDWRTGKVMTGLYDPGAAAHAVAVEAYTRFLPHNALYVNMYPSIGKMEKEIVASVAELLRADDEVVGNITSGGTESIMMAIKTARDWAKVNRPEITEPEMVLPVSAHPAFLKAAHYYNVKVVQTAIDLKEYRADLSSFENALSKNTIIAVGSAPNFSHGSIDPISKMAKLAADRGILFHVDGCVGGIYMSVMRRMGYDLPDFDFTVPGVTSISADLHKYGYAPKNSSVILYRNRDLRKYAWFVCSSTTEYVVINSTTQSSRTGGPIAAAWAIMRFMGEEGFQDIVRRSQAATEKMLEGIAKIDGIWVLGKPDMCMFTIASEQFNVFEIDDEMSQRGWQLIPQFACGGSAENLHVSLSQANVPHVDQFLKDLKEVAESLREEGPSVDLEEMKRVVETAKDKSPDEAMFDIIPVIGLTGMDLPERMAALNTVLNLFPAKLRDEMLTMFFNMTA
jgi:sphinganine-1-phosphate aldolase